MALELASPISAFFEATNRHDPDAVAGCFVTDGLVHDENADQRSRSAICEWADGTHRKYDVILTPLNVREAAEMSVVTATVAGTFREVRSS